MPDLQIGSLIIPFDKWYIGIAVELCIILLLWIFVRRKRSSIRITIEMFYEFMYKFFEEIVWEKEKNRIKSTVTTVFFIVFIANMLGWFWDIFAQAIPSLEHWFAPFSARREGVFAMSILIVLLTVVVQLGHLGPLKFVHEYLPVTGKNYLSVDRGNMPARKYYPTWLWIKIADVAISLFIGILDIIGIGAKIISLAFRLFGNMFAGTVLLALLTWASSSLTEYLLGFNFPIILPLILFLQGLLVASIQAFVVALLGSIFIKMSKTTE